MVAIRPQSVAFLVLVLAVWLLWSGRQASHQMAAVPSAVPAQIGPWVGTILPVDKRAIEILETSDVSMTEYRLGQEPPVWFAQVAGFGNRAAFHPPEICYVGSHYEVLERQRIPVLVNGRELDVMRLVIRQGPKRFEAWYWFTANGRVTANYYRQQLWLLADTIRGKSSSGTLVRISTPVEDVDTSRRRLLTFVSFLTASDAEMAHVHESTQREHQSS